MFKTIKGIVIAGVLAIASGCAVTPADVWKSTDTSVQKAYATYGVFVVYEEQAAALVENPNVAQNAKDIIKKADAKAKPMVDAMLDTALVVDSIKKDVEKGIKDKAVLYTVAASLDAWLKNAVPAVMGLIDAVKGAK